ncbi:hypothetical protein [Nocardia paucivorans]|uniref:hypothetical protein n=1 Tax=Nocardia paucivorans TaxID=114259 RepID=UPI0002E392D9|nr:hypothetical protein [Nocardia paucivorans]
MSLLSDGRRWCGLVGSPLELASWVRFWWVSAGQDIVVGVVDGRAEASVLVT